MDEGFIIPVQIIPSTEWHVSDAFGMFGKKNANHSSLEYLMEILKLVEDCWEEVNGSVLPVRWLQALSFNIDIPIHIDLFDGQSVQLPLLISVLRTLGSLHSDTLPFGDLPIFATGIVNENGTFGDVECVEQKLRGFIRELGSGLIALLTDNQIDFLKSKSNLLEKVQVVPVNNVKQLIALKELYLGLDALSKSYHPTYNETIINLSKSLSHKIQFDEVQKLSNWILSNVKSSYYQFQFFCELALINGHRGLFVEATKYLNDAKSLFESNSKYFGVDDFGSLIMVACDVLIDSMRLNECKRLIQQIDQVMIDKMSGSSRVKVYGSFCQFYRITGEFTKAIQYGEHAISLADEVYSSRAGRSRNYLIHALIIAYRENINLGFNILDKAEILLNESKGIWSPIDNKSAQLSHLGFCKHYEAELARLRGKEFDPGMSPYPDGIWSHPWQYTLLSCARNSKNSIKLRRNCFKDLIIKSQADENCNGEDSLFGLFNKIYQLLWKTFNQVEAKKEIEALEYWLNVKVQSGFPGWNQYLSPYIKKSMNFHDVEIICDAIREH
ncbi:MAG: hypothetical protein JXB49_08965 [Bacteroidales bacterium]|nr:hypothetical protein [Bacteroidales bacterium]